MSIALDYTSRISPSALKAADVSLVFRYIAPQSWKRITPSEYAELRSAGIKVILNWESSATDWKDGAAGGTQDGRLAVAQAKSLGYPVGSFIVGSADFDATISNKPAILAYAAAFSVALHAGGYVAGVYGPWDVLSWVHDAGYGYGFFWQAGMSTSWSGGRNRNLHPVANVRQRGHKTVGGVDTDWNEIISIPGSTPPVVPLSAYLPFAHLGDEPMLVTLNPVPAGAVDALGVSVVNNSRAFITAGGIFSLNNEEAKGHTDEFWKNTISISFDRATQLVKFLNKPAEVVEPTPVTPEALQAALVAALKELAGS